MGLFVSYRPNKDDRGLLKVFYGLFRVFKGIKEYLRAY